MRQLPGLMEKQEARTGSEKLSICRVAVEIDSDTYLKYNKDTSAIIEQVLSSIERSTQVFEKEINTHLVVTSIRIWKDNDPFRQSNSLSILLGILASTPPATQNFDKRIYLYTKQPSDYSGIAYLPGSMSVAPLTYVPTILHELGHNFNSPHTQSCSWPGGPIDFCVASEGNCYDKSLDQITNGTIMSYCEKISTFHPLCRAVMMNHAETSMAKIEALPEIKFSLPQNDISKGDFLSWPAVTTATSYRVSYSLRSDFQGELIEDTPFNGFSTHELILNSDYFIRVKAINSFGNSPWSDALKLHVNAKKIESPDILAPKGDQTVVSPNSMTNLSFSQIQDAVNYRIQIAFSTDINFNNPIINQIIQSTAFEYQHIYETCYRWRVRAENGENIGNWSNEAFFSVNAGKNRRFHLPIPDNMTNVPVTFPFSYYPIGRNSKVRISVADNREMANPILIRNYDTYDICTDIIKDLPANSKLFLRIEEWNEDRNYYPVESLSDYTVSFTTGTKGKIAGLTFLTELDQKTFGVRYQKLAFTENYVWALVQNAGLVQLDQNNLSFKVNSRSSTDGLIGFTYTSAIRSNRSLGLHALTNGQNNENRFTTLRNEDTNAGYDLVKLPGTITDFNPDGKLFWSSNVLYQLSLAGLVPIKTLEENTNILQVETFRNKAYILVHQNSSSGSFVIVLNLDNLQVAEKIDADTDPLIKKSINQIRIGDDGRIWLKQYDSVTGRTSIAVSVAGKWTLFDYTNSALTNISFLCLAPGGTAYVLTTGAETKIFKYDNAKWTQIGATIPLQYFGSELQVDKNENMWILGMFGLARLTTCSPVPVISSIKNTIDSGDEIQIKAQNCTNGQIWSWKNQERNVKDSLVKSDSIIKLTLLSTTYFTVRCAGSNCSSDDTTFTIKVNPVISVRGTDKKEYCQAEEIIVNVLITGSLEADNIFGAILKSGDGTQYNVTKLKLNGDNIQFSLPSEVTPGNYILKIKTSNPVKVSKDSVSIIIHEIPSARLTTDKTELIPVTDTAKILVMLIGNKPWTFTLWNNQPITTELQDYQMNFSLSENYSYSLTVKNLSDRYCKTGTVLNTLTITPVIITSVSNLQNDYQIDIYPNPTTDKIIIKFKSPVTKESQFLLYDQKGTRIQSFTTKNSFSEWDISSIPLGLYLIKTNSKRGVQSWKIVKE
ncbi:M12 family metallo-peptidase [Dyadobacter sp. NIV53]|uniref:M12 family metallo-peptidase n=1 Tax=Dyadobacter sp. NIV53 TaxID=2861765 RepID=UPI001C86DF86|nr:M12 family metallo-peptidase [Dyadobacter sp. NIV53]